MGSLKALAIQKTGKIEEGAKLEKYRPLFYCNAFLNNMVEGYF